MTVDADYANAPHIPDGAAYPARWAAAAAAFRAAHPPETLRYGEAPRARVDLFRPAAPAKGVMVFVHGGFWRAFGREDWSHLAGGALARGWAVALPSYTLAPEARISEITADIARSIDCAAAAVGGPIALTGHSAGGHLVARMLGPDVPLAAAGRLHRVVPISPLGDLRVFLGSGMNADFRLDPAQAAAESPILCADRRDVPVHVWVGAAERPAFVAQARDLAAAWGCPCTEAAGRHHFDVIDGLADPDSPLMTAVLG